MRNLAMAPESPGGTLASSDLPKPVAPAVFRDALRQFASGVTVITTGDPQGTVHGMTATAFSSLSLDPPLVLIAIGRDTRCHSRIVAAERFGVSILRLEQAPLSRHFGGRPEPDFAPRFGRLGDVPVLDDALVQIACQLDQVVEGGDHSIFIGLVTSARTREGAPLLHFGGAYRALDDDATV